MAAQFTPAPSIKKIAEEVIGEHHSHLLDARIEYVFTDKVNKKGGKEVWGSMKKISGINAYFAGKQNEQENGATEPFFVMIVAQEIWDHLTPFQRTAFADHLLCQAKVEVTEKGDVKLLIVGYDVEESSSIVERYGLWRDDVRKFVEVAKPAHHEIDDFKEAVKINEEA